MYSVLQLSQLIRNVWICGRIDSSSIIAHPIYTTGTIAKIRCQEVDISIIDRYNSFDNRYGFFVSNGNTSYFYNGTCIWPPLIVCWLAGTLLNILMSRKSRRFISEMGFIMPLRQHLNTEMARGPISISAQMSYCKILWSLKAMRFVFKIVRSLWNLTGSSVALLSMCLRNFKVMQ